MVKSFSKVMLGILVANNLTLAVVPLKSNQVYAEEQNQRIISTDFNDQIVGESPQDFNIEEEGGTVKIAPVPSETNKSVFLEDTSDKHHVQLSRKFENETGKIAISFDFMQPEYGNNTKIARIKGKGTAVILETKDGAIQYRHGDDKTYTSLNALEEKSWYSIKIILDEAQQTATISINDKLVVEDEPFYQQATGIDFFETFTANSGQKGHYIDNFKVEKLAKDETTETTDSTEASSSETTETTEFTETNNESEVFDQQYEAEEANSQGTKVDNKHAGYTGSGFIDFYPNEPGGWIEWDVEVPKAGEYTLAFRYAHGGTDSRPAKIAVNGETVNEALAFDPSADFSDWVYSSFKANLTEGKNSIRMTPTASASGANIDHLRVHNKAEEDIDGPTEIDNSKISDIVNGFELKKMKELGLIVDELPDESKVIDRMTFFAMVNDALGLTGKPKYKGVSQAKATWEVSMEDWDNFILQAAAQKGYADDLVSDGKIDAHKEITKSEAESVLEALDIKSTLSGSEGLTFKEASAALKDVEKDAAQIAEVYPLSSNVVAVVLDSYFPEFDLSDLDLVIPVNEWKSLSPKFEKIRADKAATGVNRYGQSVVVIHSLDTWDENGEIAQNTSMPPFSGELSVAVEQANNLLTWQMDNGGWTKNWPQIYTRPWDGKEPKSEWVKEDGTELGTIDNDATVNEIIFLAQVYQETKDEKYRDSIEKALQFLKNLQYPTGGFAQVYPARGNYSDYVTFNDNAMVNVLDLLDQIAARDYPFDNGLISDQQQQEIKASINSAIDYILKAQIKVDGKLTAWCAQHDPETYEPQQARAYEHPSISGSESIGVIRYLMSRPQTEEIRQAVEAALEWFDESKLENTDYISADPNEEYFVEKQGATTWYRFYDIKTNKGIFSGRDGVIKYDIKEIEKERRDGYRWGGNWGKKILDAAEKTGFYENKVFVQVSGANSKDDSGHSLKKDTTEALNYDLKQMDDFDTVLTVSKDGSADYDTVQAAVDAVPKKNETPVTIQIKNGTYKEVIEIPKDKPFISLIGEDPEKTILTFDNYAKKDNGLGGTFGTTGSSSVFLKANGTRVENLTIENSFDEATEEGGSQAVAAYVQGERMYFKNVRFIGNQDTLYTRAGTQYYTQCYIEGDVDFIFGEASVVINHSEIHSIDRQTPPNNGFITAASTLIDNPYGIMIQNSKFTSDAAAKSVYLGRPWPAGGNPNAIGSVLIRDSELGAHIRDDGWSSMSGMEPKDARLNEYNNYGPGASVNKDRPQLSDEQAAEWTVKNVLKGWDPSQGETDPNPDPEEPADEVDYSKLEGLLNEIKELLENHEKYTEESLKKLEALMKEATEILKEKTATIDELKEMITALTKAKDSLEVEETSQDKGSTNPTNKERKNNNHKKGYLPQTGSVESNIWIVGIVLIVVAGITVILKKRRSDK